MTTSSMLFAKNLNQFQKNNADYGKRCTNTLRGKAAGSCPSRGLKVLRLEIPHGFIIAKQAFGIRLCARHAATGTRITPSANFAPVDIVEITLPGK